MGDINHAGINQKGNTYTCLYGAQPSDAIEEVIRPSKVTNSALPIVEQLYTARGAQGMAISENLRSWYDLEIEGEQTSKSLFFQYDEDQVYGKRWFMERALWSFD